MKVIFTKNGSALSKLIRWGFNEPVSHVAIVFDNLLVTQSNLLGVGLEWYPKLIEKSEVVFEIDYDLTLDSEEEIFQAMLNTYCGKSYDWWSFLYFAWCGLKAKLFKTPMPKENPWDDNKKFLCTEWVLQLPDWILKEKKCLQGTLITPYNLYLALKFP